MKRIALLLTAGCLSRLLAGCMGSHSQYVAGDCGGCAEEVGCDSCSQPSCDSCASPNAGLAGLVNVCGGCGGMGCGLCRRAIAPGPQMGAVTYPYYTTRGPRDFLARNPMSIGP